MAPQRNWPGISLDFLSKYHSPFIRIQNTPSPLLFMRNDLLIPDFVSLKGSSVAQDDEGQVDLAWIWKIAWEPSFRFFLWLTWSDRIPLKNLLYNRRLIVIPRKLTNVLHWHKELILSWIDVGIWMTGGGDRWINSHWIEGISIF